MDLLDFFVDYFSFILVAAVLLIFIAGMIIRKLTGNPFKGKIHPVGIIMIFRVLYIPTCLICLRNQTIQKKKINIL